MITDTLPLQNLAALSQDELTGLLRNPLLTDDEIITGIRYVRALLLKRALPPLFELVISTHRSLNVRQLAAEAISEIMDSQSKTLLHTALASEKS